MAQVLIVEPTPELSDLLAHVVLRAGHEPIEHGGLPEHAPRRVDALLLEPAAPGALALARRLRRDRPGLPVVCLSLAAATPEVLALEPVAFLEKPFALRDVHEALRRALAASATLPTAS